MLFHVTHITEFRYSHPVFLEPHRVQLRPRHDSWQRLLDFDMRVEPAPAGLSTCMELDGNESDRLWFNGLQKGLTITTKFTVETLRTNPFDYVLDPAGLRLPVVYDEEVSAALAPYRDRASSESQVVDFAESIAEEVDRETAPFLSILTNRIQGRSKIILRRRGDPWPPSRTLTQGRGACRDLAVLMMDACRAMGLAARFVSGYQEADPARTERELHAWVEVYLPGAGWRGYDPTGGLAVSDGHVALAAGAIPRATAPTSGAFRGTGATSTMRTDIHMKVTNPEFVGVETSKAEHPGN